MVLRRFVAIKSKITFYRSSYSNNIFLCVTTLYHHHDTVIACRKYKVRALTGWNLQQTEIEVRCSVHLLDARGCRWNLSNQKKNTSSISQDTAAPISFRCRFRGINLIGRDTATKIIGKLSWFFMRWRNTLFTHDQQTSPSFEGREEKSQIVTNKLNASEISGE